MSLAASIDALTDSIRAQSGVLAIFHMAVGTADLFLPHDPRHLARSRRRGRSAQRALMAWAEERGMRVTIPALRERQARHAAAHMAAARKFGEVAGRNASDGRL